MLHRARPIASLWAASAVVCLGCVALLDGVACVGGDPDPEPDAPVADAGLLDDECVDGGDCPLGAPCTLGVCDTAGLPCSGEFRCGRHFDCLGGECKPPLGACALPCCDDRGCGSLERCESFECVPISCTSFEDCLVILGATPVFGCRFVEDCPAGSECIDTEPTRCIELAAPGCEADGNSILLFLTTDGIAAPLCVNDAPCVDGRCAP